MAERFALAPDYTSSCILYGPTTAGVLAMGRKPL